MRKISKILVLIVVWLLGINIVNADNCENVRLKADSTGSNGYPFVRDAIKMKFASSTEGRLLNFQDSSGKDIPSYCHNVSKPTGAKYGVTIFSCRKEIFDSTTPLVTSDIRNVYDAGLIKILANGYNVNNKGTGVAGYTATDLAVKTYELLWPSTINSNNMNSGSQTNYLKAYQSFANKMLDDNDVKSKLKDATGSVRNKYSNAISYTWASNGDQIEAKAKELILMGLNEAIRFKKDGAASISWNSNPVVAKDAVLNNGTVTNYSGSLAYTFKISGFVSTGAFANVKFSCPNCSTNGVNYTIYANDEEIGKNYTDKIDLLSRVTNGNGEVTIKVKFDTTSNTYSCEELDYKFEVNYKEETISNTAYEMYSTDPSCSANACQPIYTITNTNVDKTTTIEDTFAMCTLTCEELKAKCDAAGSSSKACEEFKKQYPKGCVNCGVGIKNNICADPGKTTSLDLIEGYEIDPETCTQGNSANITGCILENKDPAGNSYVYLDNGLCTVSCKEDFHFNMPGNMDVSSGRYFVLKTDVKATKTCYLKMNSSPYSVVKPFDDGAQETQNLCPACQIGKEVSDLDVDDFRLVNTIDVKCGTKTVTTKTVTGSDGTYADILTCREKDSKPQSCTERVVNTDVDIKGPISTYVATVKYVCGCNQTAKSETIKVTENIIKNGDKCAPEGKKNAVDRIKKQYVKDGEAACSKLDEMNAKGSVRESTTGGVSGGGKLYVAGDTSMTVSGCTSESIYCGIGVYNACVAWEMSYGFNPDMHFNYEEGYMKSAITDQLDLVGDVKKGNTTHYYCATDDKDSAYEKCSGGWKTDPIYTTHTACVCTSEKCENVHIAVNATMRMTESVSYEAAYITPTQFYSIYPSGEIVVAMSGEGLENATELTNALPVGLGTPQGVHHYALFAKNLGEYFGKGKYGRVWGNKNSVVATTLKRQDKCIKDGALRYDVDLNGTYIDKGVWVCNYNINTGGSCVKVTSSDGQVTYYGPDGNITDAATYEAQCVCPDCPVECDESGCQIICPDGNCPVICDKCLYSNGKNFVFRTVSLNKINPNNRKLGANWSYNDSKIDSGIELKAKITTDEIIADGESVYDENSDKYVMKITLDSATINKIKSRKEKEYTANTLKCYDYTQDGKTYKNIFCYSTYLDELVTDSKTKDKIQFRVERPFTEAERKNSQNSEYWTTWSKKLASSKWNINTTKEITYYMTGYGDTDIGPSWK